MYRRILPAVLAIAAAIAWSPVRAQYNYGGYGGVEDQGFVLELEGILMNARNTDIVVATRDGFSQVLPLIPEQEDELAGRLGLGYKWASGNLLMVRVWWFGSDNDVAYTGVAGQELSFGIGPPIPFNGGYVGNVGDPGAVTSDIQLDAGTAELTFGREHEISEGFRMEWALGLTYATYEEEQQAEYTQVAGFDSPSVPVLATKTIETDMIGAKVKARGNYRFSTHWSVGAGLGLSFLDGESDTRSRLSPQGTIGGSAVPYNEFVLTDDGRSGNIIDFDVTFAWHSASDRTRVYLGWEQQRWNDLPADPARNFPGTIAPLPPRDSVTFSGFKLGLRFVL